MEQPGGANKGDQPKNCRSPTLLKLDLDGNVSAIRGVGGRFFPFGVNVRFDSSFVCPWLAWSHAVCTAEPYEVFEVTAFSWHAVVYWVRVFLHPTLVAQLLLWVSNTFLETVHWRSVHSWCTFYDGSVVEVFDGAGRPLVRSTRLMSDFKVFGCSTCRFASGSFIFFSPPEHHELWSP